MREDRCRPAQTIVNKGLRLLMGCSETDTRIPIGALQMELDVAPIYALAAGRRARAFKKYGSLKTWCQVLFEYPMKDEHSSAWIKRTEIWLNSFYEGEAEKDKYKGCLSIKYIKEKEIEKDDRKKLTYDDKVVYVAWASRELNEKSGGFKQYVENRFDATTWCSMKSIPMAAVAEQVRLGWGMRLLSMCRINALPTAARMAKPWEGSKKPPPLPEEYQTKCPCCGQIGKGETIEHIVVECSKWAEQRDKYLAPLMDSLKQQHLSVTGMCIRLLGGEHKGERLSNWLPSSQKKQPEAQTRPLGQGQISDLPSCGAFQMARFLQAIDRPRNLILRKVRRGEDPGYPLQTRGLESCFGAPYLNTRSRSRIRVGRG